MSVIVSTTLFVNSIEFKLFLVGCIEDASERSHMGAGWDFRIDQFIRLGNAYREFALYSI